MRVFIRDSSTRFSFLPVKMFPHGQNITSSRTKCWLHLLLFITYPHIVRPSQSILSTRDLNFVFIWVGDAKEAVVACPGYIRSLDCPAGLPEQCRSAWGWGMSSGRGLLTVRVLWKVPRKSHEVTDYFGGGGVFLKMETWRTQRHQKHISRGR